MLVERLIRSCPSTHSACSGSNDMSYLNHIVCGHYNANYGCGQCLKEVLTTRQQLKGHLKICMGFPKEAQAGTPSSPEEKCTPQDPPPDLQPPPQSSQDSLQACLHHSQYSKKKTSDSAKKFSREDSQSKVHKKSKHHKDTPKKEKLHRWDKADKSKSDKSCEK